MRAQINVIKRAHDGRNVEPRKVEAESQRVQVGGLHIFIDGSI